MSEWVREWESEREMGSECMFVNKQQTTKLGLKKREREREKIKIDHENFNNIYTTRNSDTQIYTYIDSKNIDDWLRTYNL